MNGEKEKRRGQGRVFVRGRTVWIQFSDHGRQVRQSTKLVLEGDDEADKKIMRKAEKILQQKTGAVANNIPQNPATLRYEQMRDAYLEAYELQEHNKGLRCDKDGTAYLESVRRLDGFFAGSKAAEIDVDLLRKFQRQLRSEGYANGSINRSMAALRRMFTLALEDEKLTSAPHFRMLPEAKPRKDVLPQGQYPALVNALPSYLRLPLIIGFHTGMREGEILGLTWANVNWLERIIRIEDSKNGDARELPFDGEVEAALRKAYTERQPECEFVCYRIDRKGHARQIGNFRKPWYRCCVKLGLGKMEQVRDRVTGEPLFEKPRYRRSKPRPKMKYNGLVFHGLRRTFITDAEHAGVPRHEAMVLSGHRTESVYKRYVIENRTQRRVAVRTIAEYRAQKVGDNSGTNQQSPTQTESVSN